MGEVVGAMSRGRVVARISAIGAMSALCLVLAACGGRPSKPVPERRAIDSQLSCSHVIAEKRSLKKRVADLRDERIANRKRSLARVPSAVVSGNPFSAIFFADPSVAIYKEINAANKRQRVLDQLLREKGCIAPVVEAAAPVSVAPPVVPAAAPVQPTNPTATETVDVAPPAPVTVQPAPTEAAPPPE